MIGLKRWLEPQVIRDGILWVATPNVLKPNFWFHRSFPKDYKTWVFLATHSSLRPVLLVRDTKAPRRMSLSSVQTAKQMASYLRQKKRSTLPYILGLSPQLVGASWFCSWMKFLRYVIGTNLNHNMSFRIKLDFSAKFWNDSVWGNELPMKPSQAALEMDKTRWFIFEAKIIGVNPFQGKTCHIFREACHRWYFKHLF